MTFHAGWFRFLAGTVVLLSLLASQPATAGEQMERDLAARLEALEREVRQLKALLSPADAANGEAEAERIETAPAIGAGREGFHLQSADGAFALRLRGLLHSDGRFYRNDRADVAADTFLVRRVRPIVDATMFGKYDFRLMPDFGDGRVLLQDAYLDLRWTTAFKVRAGKFKAPFGLERLVSAGELLFTERALPTALVPNRDTGIMAYGDLASGRVSYFAGAFNGVADGSSADADDRDGKDIVARLFAHPFRGRPDSRLNGLGAGVAASHGEHRGTAAAPALSAYRTTGQQTFFRYLGDGTAAGSVLANGTRQRISAQGYFYAGRLGFLAEQVYSRQEVRRGTVTGAAAANAWQAATSWVLTGEAASYRGVTPRTVFDPANGTWGAFEVTGRYHEFRAGAGVFPLFANAAASAERAQAAALGVNWYLNRNVKLVMDYEETHFSGGAPSGDRAPARELLSRLQFSF